MPETNSVIDLYHHNGTVDLEVAKQNGLMGIFQKATQGTSNVDPSFNANRTAAKQAGLLFGTYHFGTGSDGIEQASISSGSSILRLPICLFWTLRAILKGPA